ANSPQTLLPGYFEAGLTLWRRFALRCGSTIEVRGDIINLFDKQYAVIARYPMPGRSWMFAVKYIL
ncbi:MAG: TonB-dependent receptor, partial [Muribaculaceae bacterium]|nr:TonB-dependent receptor [Muribaculaceae bacterium]